MLGVGWGCGCCWVCGVVRFVGLLVKLVPFVYLVFELVEEVVVLFGEDVCVFVGG